MLAKEKPDLLFNNPLKQKVYVFLKNNPGKDFEAFQVLTGDSAVARQHFNEVEQAIRAREERDRVRAVSRDVNALFLQGAIGEKSRGGTSDSPEEKERILKKIEKKKLNEKAKQYIKEHPSCTYEELVKALEFQELSKPHFFSMKTQLRKKGLISEESRTRRGRKPGEKKAVVVHRESRPAASASTTKTVEILESIDADGFSEEIREHYKSHIMPLLRKLIPGGESLQLVFLSDPPTYELRRGVS
ncbi:MAG: hypothetical protein JF616_07045 [Fibrobacteres bacterium]|nr:hypothetical protein [Fibrobacterota bacterium]